MARTASSTAQTINTVPGRYVLPANATLRPPPRRQATARPSSLKRRAGMMVSAALRDEYERGRRHARRLLVVQSGGERLSLIHI